MHVQNVPITHGELLWLGGDPFDNVTCDYLTHLLTYLSRPVFKSQYDETFASEFGTFLAKLPDVISRLESKNIRFNVPPPGVDCSTEPCSTNTIVCISYLT